MKLSIGMIVKDEEKYLEQCLTALKPILENVDSELIIADTGSTDRTVEIAKQFTDNVFHFEWINDFAAARNSTLDKAKGEWYMYIDGDEIIKDASELIEFFNSGEYHKYGAATYVQRNYNDLQNMDLYSDYNAPRMSALKNGVRFYKKIHEVFDQNFEPVKNLNVIADHYGYVYKDGEKLLELREKKTSRNLELLFQELEEQKAKGEIKYTTYGQIADCYIWLEDYDNAIKYIDLGMENCHRASYTYIDYFIKKIKTLYSMKKYEDAIEVGNQYFSKDDLARTQKLVSDCTIYFYMAKSSYMLKKYDDAINRSIIGFEIYRDYLKGKLFTPELNYCSVDATIPLLKQICSMFFDSCTKLKKYDIAAREADIMPIDKFMSDAKFMKLFLKLRVEVMEKTNYNRLPDLYYSLDETNREMFVNILIRNVLKTEQIEHFLKKLSIIANGNERLADMIKLCSSFFIHHDLKPGRTTEFIEKHGTKDNEVVWILMMKRNFDITPFICAKDFDPLESVDNVYQDLVQADAAMALFSTQMQRLSNEGLEKAVTVFESAVISATGYHFDTTKVIQIFFMLGKRWKELNPDKELPENVAFALELGEVSDHHRRKRYEEAVKQLNKLIEEELIKTPAAPEQPNDSEKTGEDEQTEESGQTYENEKVKILRHYLFIVNKDMEKNAEMAEKQNADPVLTELAANIKKEIRTMIDAWDLDGAEDALNQMAKMAPFDPDIEDIRDEIIDRKINYMNYM